MRRPGATRSGFAFESGLPQAENQASMSSPRPRVPRSSVAPTVITYGSMPGVTTVSRCGPPFPDAVREDPLDPPYHRGDPAAPGPAEHPDVNDVGLRSDADELAAGAHAIPGDDPRDMRP